MSQPFNISNELAAYFDKMDTCRAVNHMLSSSAGSDWVDLSIQEFNSRSESFDGYDKYAAAWLYSKKVQKDYFDFMGEIWALSWGGLVSQGFKRLGQPTNFKTVEKVWEDGWYRSFELKQVDEYDDLWLYCERLGEDSKSHGIRLSFTLGKEQDYSMNGLSSPPENWLDKDEGDDRYFRKELSFHIEDKQVKISDTEISMKEIGDFLKDKVFKS